MITAPVALRPWPAPNFAVVKSGDDTLSIPIRDLPEETLDELAAAWLTELYQKAEKGSPWSRGP